MTGFTSKVIQLSVFVICSHASNSFLAVKAQDPQAQNRVTPAILAEPMSFLQKRTPVYTMGGDPILDYPVVLGTTTALDLMTAVATTLSKPVPDCIRVIGDGQELAPTDPVHHATLSVVTSRPEAEGKALARIRAGTFDLAAIPDSDFNDNRDIVLAAVRQDGMALEFAGTNVHEDKEVVLAAVQQNGSALRFAFDFQEDEEVVLAAVRQEGRLLQWAHPDMKQRKNVVLAAVQHTGWALQFAHADMQRDEDVVVAAVQHDHSGGGVLRHCAHEDMRNNKKVVLAAVQKWGVALKHASNNLQEDPDVALAAVQENAYALQYTHYGKYNKEIVLAAVRQEADALRFAGYTMRRDKEVVLAALQKTNPANSYTEMCEIMQSVPLDIQRDRDVAQVLESELRREREAEREIEAMEAFGAIHLGS